MSGWTPLYASIVNSTIWRSAKETKILWITMLAMVNRQGIVESSLPGLADAARLTIQETEFALADLTSPDPHSRTRDCDGRRVQGIDGGWLILNYAKYRLERDPVKRADQNREAQRRFRERSKPESKPSNPEVRAGKPMQIADADREKTTSSPAPRPRNALFDVLVSVTGANPAVAGGEIGRAIAAIKTLTPDVTPEEILRRAANYHVLMPDCTLSASALAKWWAKCDVVGPARPARSRLTAGEFSAASEADHPFGEEQR